MAYEEQGRKISTQLAGQYGKLVEARLEKKGPAGPWRIVLVFDRGEWTVPSDFIFKFGYSGSGPDCFHAFLRASGWRISKDRVENAKEGDILRAQDFQ